MAGIISTILRATTWTLLTAGTAMAGESDTIFKYMDPTHYTTEERYTHLWKVLFATLLSGVFGRVAACCCLGCSIWFALRRRNIVMSSVFFGVAVLITFGAAVLKFAGMI